MLHYYGGKAFHKLTTPLLTNEEVDVVIGGLDKKTFEFRVGGGMGPVGNKFNEVKTVKVIGGILQAFK